MIKTCLLSEITVVCGRIAWSSSYTYILLLFVAAAFLAYLARPKQRGAAIQRLIAGTLLAEGEVAPVDGPCLNVRCTGGGMVVIDRLDVTGLTASGAVSLAVEFVGSDVRIVERVSAGYGSDTPMTGAEFRIDMTGHEWRHVRWTNEDSGLWCAFTLHVREGIRFTVPLKR